MKNITLLQIIKEEQYLTGFCSLGIKELSFWLNQSEPETIKQLTALILNKKIEILNDGNNYLGIRLLRGLASEI